MPLYSHHLMKRIFVVYNRSDIDCAILQAKSGDYIFGDVATPPSSAIKTFMPHLEDCEKSDLSARTIGLFDSLCEQYGKNIRGFCNIFFEATVLPIASYAHALERILRKYEDDGLGVEVVFPVRIILPKRTATYFLAEHEAQRIFLYPRYAVFQPYLVEVCKAFSNVKIRYVGGYRWPALSLQLVIRRYSMLLLRFFLAAAKTLLQTHIETNINTDIDLIALSRSPSKSQFLSPLLSSARVKSLLLVGESFSHLSRNLVYCRNVLGLHTTHLQSPPQPPLSRLLLLYCISFLRQLLPVDREFDTGIVRINIEQPIREMLINYPDLEAYYIILKKHLSSCKLNFGIVISTELKSQYAFADAQCAHEAGFKCLHLMDCDHVPHPLPQPVFGDLLLVDSEDTLGKLCDVWPACANRLKYFGNLRGFTQSTTEYPTGSNSRWCFFTSTNIDGDREVVSKLQSISKKTGLIFFVKLHPRDSLVRYLSFPSVNFIVDDKITKQKLFESFDFALTFNSAIINDLIIQNKPFLLLDFIAESHFNHKAHSKNFEELIVNDIDDLGDFMKNVNDMVQSFHRYRSVRVMQDQAIDPTNFFLDNLFNHLGSPKSEGIN